MRSSSAGICKTCGTLFEYIKFNNRTKNYCSKKCFPYRATAQRRLETSTEEQREKARIRNRRYISSLTPEQKLAKSRADNKRNKAKGWPNQIKYRQEHPEKVKEAWHNWYKANPIANKARSALSRALRKGTTGNKVLIEELLERDGEYCTLCGLPLDDSVTIDHLKAIHNGGTHELSNLGLAHLTCNSSKGSKDFISWALAH